jgi:hypothetical protein
VLSALHLSAGGHPALRDVQRIGARDGAQEGGRVMMREDWQMWTAQEWGAFYRVIQSMAESHLLIAEHPAWDGVIVGDNLRIVPNAYRIGEGSIILYYDRQRAELEAGE